MQNCLCTGFDPIVHSLLPNRPTSHPATRDALHKEGCQLLDIINPMMMSDVIGADGKKKYSGLFHMQI